MIKIGPLGNSGGGGLIDATAIHTDRSYEIMSLVEIPLLMGNEVIVLEDPLNGYAKRKVTIGSFSGVDINAFHKTISGEFDALVEKFPAASEDLFVIEDSNDLYSKKKIQLQAITLDNIGEGTTYKKFLSTERTKLTGIEDNADVTDVDNVTTAEESINVNAHSDITSAGADIEDAVSKRHTQGTDTTLGIQAQNSDWGTYRITNAGEPVDPGDYATKNYVDTQELSHDPNAVHLNAGSEITTLTEKVSPVATDIIIIEDSEDLFSKKKVVFPIYSDHDPNAVHLNAGSEITTLTEKISPVVDDIIIIEDSEDSFAKKKVAFPVYSDHDPNAIHLNADSEITTLDEKITPVATDILIIEDSEDSFSKKKVSFPLLQQNRIYIDHTRFRMAMANPSDWEIGGFPGNFTNPSILNKSTTYSPILLFDMESFGNSDNTGRILIQTINFPQNFDKSKGVRLFISFFSSTLTPEVSNCIFTKHIIQSCNSPTQISNTLNFYYDSNTQASASYIGLFNMDSFNTDDYFFNFIWYIQRPGSEHNFLEIRKIWLNYNI